MQSEYKKTTIELPIGKKYQFPKGYKEWNYQEVELVFNAGSIMIENIRQNTWIKEEIQQQLQKDFDMHLLSLKQIHTVELKNIQQLADSQIQQNTTFLQTQIQESQKNIDQWKQLYHQEKITNQSNQDSIQQDIKQKLDNQSISFNIELTRQQSITQTYIQMYNDTLQKLTSIQQDAQQSYEKKLTESTQTFQQQYNQLEQSKNEFQKLYYDEMLQRKLDKENYASAATQQANQIAKEVIQEKEKHIDKITQNIEKSITQLNQFKQSSTSSSAQLGKIGESSFKQLSEHCFRDFQGFVTEDKHCIGGMGDFHLHFHDFSVLVDAKKYSSKVNNTSIQKIERDLRNNEHIQIAWLISLDTPIEKYDKSPFILQWTDQGKLICYVNSLLKQPDPAETLRNLWFTCKTIKEMMTSDNNDIDKFEINAIRQKQINIKNKLTQLEKNQREIDNIHRQMKEKLQQNHDFILNLLNDETNETFNEHNAIITQWWNTHLLTLPTTENNNSANIPPLKSSDLWNHFHKEHPAIDNTTFKNAILSYLPETRIVKGNSGGFTIVGYQWAHSPLKRKNPEPKIPLSSF
jgi:hypothetical protein